MERPTPSCTRCRRSRVHPSARCPTAGPSRPRPSLVPPADEAGERPLLVRVRNAAGEHGWRLHAADCVVTSPFYPCEDDVVVQTGAVLDVYAGLLVGLARADWPADGRVRVGRTVFLRRLRWCGQDGRVSGRAYQQLDAALAHLMGMAIRSSAIEHVIEADPGSAGELTFRILQAYGRVSDSGPDGDDGAARPDAGHRADDLVVYFTTPFVRSLRGTERRVTYRLSHYLDFGQGAPRALYRYVCYLATQPLVNGSVEVSVDELLASVGSHLRGVPPAKVRQLCGQAFDQMVNRGILRRPPVYRRVRGGPNPRYVVEIRPGAPPTPALEALLYEALVAYGVQTSMAHRLVMPTRTGSPSWSRPPRSV